MTNWETVAEARGDHYLFLRGLFFAVAIFSSFCFVFSYFNPYKVYEYNLKGDYLFITFQS